MSTNENLFQTLTQLGLSALETRTYLTFCNRESLTAKEISILTKTSQPDVYRVLTKLQNKGLIEKIIEIPARFKAVPLETSINFLLKRKEVEHDDLTVKSKLLIQAIKEKKFSEKPFETIESSFTMIPQRETIVRRINEAIERSKKTVDICLSWRRFLTGITGTFAESSERAWDRGVKFRIISEHPAEVKAVAQALQFCGKSPLCNIKFLPGKTKAVIGLYDQKEVFIIVDPKQDLFDSPALWSNNPSLLTVVEDYFETLWITAMEEPLPRHISDSDTS